MVANIAEHKTEEEREEEIQSELENWNFVKCFYCGRKLNMLKKEVSYIFNGSTPVCRGGCDGH